MLPALTTLVLRGDLEVDANAFLTALCPPVLLFPNLTTLRIFVNAFALPLSRSLVQVASQRVQHGHPIRHLIIEYNGTPRKGDGTIGATEGVNTPTDTVLATLASYIDVVEFLIHTCATSSSIQYSNLTHELFCKTREDPV
ncbi:hypothetical protein A0H81_08855 [Grifola frondosa]|uniref:Uncharacterized protein n=1 Tax=Grifola frondosa TaxID=5627 RepID=A0A1C7M4V4_GRIFR|nr:hypothetical protein A0H81_08855 [Grifola frondosa]